MQTQPNRVSDVYIECGGEVVEDPQQMLSDFMRDYGQEVLHFVRFYSRDTSEAEDLTQEVFLRAYRGLPTYREECAPKTWLLRIAVNVCNDYLRWRRRRPVHYVEHVPEAGITPSPEDVAMQSIDAKALVSSVLSLPKKYKDPVLLYYFAEQPIVDVAWALGISESAVKSRLHRARELLRNQKGGDQHAKRR